MVQLRHIPNLLTMLRLALAAVFFVVLAFYQVGNDQARLLIPAIVLFILAALTDWLDGLLARRWEVESKFGRIMDPFCDKVLVIGALCFLAGPGFALPDIEEYSGVPNGVQNVSGVYPWMVVVIIARELLVTGIRGAMEGTGHKFGANLWGKLKMILQAIVVPIVLMIVYLSDSGIAVSSYTLSEGYRTDWLASERFDKSWFFWTRDILVYATVIVTVLSGVPYAVGAYRVTKAERDQPPPPEQ